MGDKIIFYKKDMFLIAWATKYFVYIYCIYESHYTRLVTFEEFKLRECVLTELRTVNNKNYKVELYTISILMKVWKIKKKRLICILKSLIFCRYISELTNQKHFFHSYTGIAIYFVNLVTFALQDTFTTANRYPKSIFCTAFQHFPAKIC